jgi:hypothetical protein
LVARSETDNADAARTLVEELLHAGLAFTDLLASLLEKAPGMAAPADSEAVIELVLGTCRPALAGAPADGCLAAAALVQAIRSQVLETLHEARSKS